jgi:acyl-CoA dehydrogenase
MSEGLERFRDEIRAWLEAACPLEMRTPAGEADDVWGGRKWQWRSDAERLWLERAAERGVTAPTWPREYGGAGFSTAEAAIFEQELRALGCRAPLKSLGIWMLGPVLLRYGTEAQKREHLPKMARGEIRWCQGYSEPGAGSDLASLRCAATRDGAFYVVTGQKIWTSHADKADFMFCLVRSSDGASKHDGISFLLIDMASPGISVRPIRLISGASPFCETFFDGVRVPARNLVGPEGQGWPIAKAVLEHERSFMSKLRDSAVAEEEPLEALARRYLDVCSDGALAHSQLRERITQVNMDWLCNNLTLRRSAEAARAGHAPGPETSLFKLYGTELNQRRRELKVLIEGFQGLGWEGPGFSSEELTHTRDWLRSRANTIEGGSSEIQLNIIARRVLGLPD